MKSFKHLGFSATELLIFLAILGILVTVVMPQYTSFNSNKRLFSQNTLLMQDFVLAHAEATIRAKSVTVCQSNNGTSCTDSGWGSGRIVFVDHDQNGKVNHDDEILRVSEGGNSNNTMMSTETNHFITFNASGVSNTNITITTCETGQRGEKITIYPSGRIHKSSADVCG